MNSTSRRFVLSAFLLMIAACVLMTTAQAQTTTFTYQGRLTDSATTGGAYDLQFTLYNETGAPIATITRDDVPVSNGVFTVQLDFGAAAFPGADRSLEIAVRRGTETGAYTTLAPRQPITSTPYAIKSLNATNADTATTAAAAATATNAQQLGGTAASNFTQNDSQAFIRSQATLQTATFNINSTGRANIFDAATQYNINNNRILSNAGTNNLFAGVGAGSVNTGGSNSFVGASAGNANTTGAGNSFVGANAGKNNTAGAGNSFVGTNAGFSNTTGGSNSFVGTSAGQSNTTGGNNSFVGTSAGESNTTGGGNSFVGVNAGQSNTTGINNTAIGFGANVGSGALTNAAAIGSGATVSASNTIVLGRSAGQDSVRIPGTLFVGGVQVTSDRAVKTNVNRINSFSILQKIGGIPIQSWSYKKDGADVVHIGAMAQDFKAAFNFGADDKSINTIDADGVALAGIQALYKNSLQKDKQIDSLKANIETLKRSNETLETKLEQQQTTIDALRALICSTNAQAAVCKQTNR